MLITTKIQYQYSVNYFLLNSMSWIRTNAVLFAPPATLIQPIGSKIQPMEEIRRCLRSRE